MIEEGNCKNKKVVKEENSRIDVMGVLQLLRMTETGLGTEF